MGADGSRHRLTRRTRRRPRRAVRTAAARSRWTVWRRSIRKSCRGASPRAALRHRGGPLLAVSAARAGPARPADLRRVGGGCRSTGPERRRAGRRVAHRAGHAVGEGRPRSADPVRIVGDQGRPRPTAAPHRRRGGAPRMRRCASRSARVRWSRRMRRAVPRLNAILHWLWAFATPETTVYAICDGRGFADAVPAVLGPRLRRCAGAGRLGPAYRGFKKAPHQTCLSHLLPDAARTCSAAHPDSPWAARCRRS